jgi:hypothetical protein
VAQGCSACRVRGAMAFREFRAGARRNASLSTTRARQWRMEETFSPEDRSLARNEPPAVRPDGRGPIEWLSRWPWLRRVAARLLPDGRGPMELFVVVLCGVVIVAGILAGYAIWRLP